MPWCTAYTYTAFPQCVFAHACEDRSSLQRPSGSTDTYAASLRYVSGCVFVDWWAGRNLYSRCYTCKASPPCEYGYESWDEQLRRKLWDTFGTCTASGQCGWECDVGSSRSGWKPCCSADKCRACRKHHSLQSPWALPLSVRTLAAACLQEVPSSCPCLERLLALPCSLPRWLTARPCAEHADVETDRIRLVQWEECLACSLWSNKNRTVVRNVCFLFIGAPELPVKNNKDHARPFCCAQTAKPQGG